jgi:hypothetical protein
VVDGRLAHDPQFNAKSQQMARDLRFHRPGVAEQASAVGSRIEGDRGGAWHSSRPSSLSADSDRLLVPDANSWVQQFFIDSERSLLRASISIHKVLRFYAAGLACRRVWTAPTAALVGGFGTPPITAPQRGVPPWESLGSKKWDSNNLE